MRLLGYGASWVLLCIFLMQASGNAQTNSGTITIRGGVSNNMSFSVTSDGVLLNPLGAGWTNKKVGKIVLSSNWEGGFLVSLRSKNKGFIARQGAVNQSNRIGYTVTFSNRQGNIGVGIIEPTLTNINPDGGQLRFVRQQDMYSPTIDLSYDVGVNVIEHNNLEAGQDYSDVLTLSFSTL